MWEFSVGNLSEVKLDWEQDGDALIAVLTGRIDSTNVFGLEQSVNEGLSKSHQILVFDMAAVNYVSSAALALMLRLAKKYMREAKSFGVCTETENIREVISISGFDRIISLYDSRADALSAIRGD